jgi:hypothetical protein
LFEFIIISFIFISFFNFFGACNFFSNSASNGFADEQLIQNVLDEINRLNNELKDLEQYKDEFTPEEIEETKKKTLEQLSETQKILEKMKKGNISVMTKYEESQKKLRQVIAENYHVNDLINSYLANETEFLREKLQSTIRLHALKKISEPEFNSQVVQILEMISKNEQIVFNNLDKIKNLDKKIIDEIIEKTFKNLIYGNTILLEESDELDSIKEEYENIENNLHIIKIEQLNKLIEFLMEINKSKNNFFDLITSEYAFLLSKNSILELKTLPHPSLQVDIHFSDYSFYCQEFPLDIILNHKKIILIVSYKTEDQSFNINIKLLNNRMATQKNINSILEIDRISEEKYIEDN